MTRVAAVDLGTNTTRLLVAEVADAELTELARRQEVTRLGQGVDASGRLAPGARERVLDCLGRYRELLAELEPRAVLAVATSAVRDARDGSALLREVESRLGAPTRLLAGEEEAGLTYRGVSAGVALPGTTAVIDLGGGSTEIVIGDAAGIGLRRSLELGSVRLTERHLGHDPPESCEIEELVLAVRRALLQDLPAETLPSAGIGVAGTVTTLAALHSGLSEEAPGAVHGHRVPVAWLAAEARRLASTPVAVLRHRPGIVPARAPVIAAGALAVAEICGFFELEELWVSEWDLLHGVALDLAEHA